MLIDSSHRRWLVFSVLIMLVSTALYVPYELRHPVTGPRGSTWEGLTYGGVSTFFMLIAALIGVRRKLRTWHLGRASWWVKAHLWLGLLAYPLMFFHAGFRLGGALTVALIILFTVVVVTGIYGVVVQQLVPSLMTDQVQVETMFEQIPVYVGRLREDARKAVTDIAGPLPDSPPPDPKAKVAAAAEGSEPLKKFYLAEIADYLANGKGRLAHVASRGAAFSQVKPLLPAPVSVVATFLEDLCEERRQLDSQVRLHSWLHSWLLIHLPAAVALVALTVVHAITALYY